MKRNLTKSTVVIGQQKTFRTDHFCGASTIEMNHSILQRTIIDAVDILCAQVHAHGLHIAFDSIEQCRNPHALLGLCVICRNQGQNDE